MAMMNPDMVWNQTPAQTAPAAETESSGGFNWDTYTGGVTGQPSQQIDPQGTPQVYTGGYDPNSPLYRGNGGGTQIPQQGMQTPQMWDQNSFQQQFGSPGTPQELEALESKLNAAGIKVSRNAAGVAGKIILPNGQYVDVINSAGAGGKGFQWLTGDGGAPGGAQGGGAAGMNFGSLLTPWDQQFSAPTAEQALASPGLKFALDEANRIGQSSAASHGTLLNGRVQQALGASNVQNALQGYGDVYNRALGEYGLQRENFYNNQDRPYTKLSGLAGMGANAANQTGGYGSSYGSDASGAIYGAGNATSAGSTRQGNVWGDYVTNLGSTLGGR
jgi:hypothetical protein